MTRWLLAVYRFVVGDPILLWGGLGSAGVAYLLRGLGAVDGVAFFLGVTAALAISLFLRPD
jgi:hypothetical protein